MLTPPNRLLVPPPKAAALNTTVTYTTTTATPTPTAAPPRSPVAASGSMHPVRLAPNVDPRLGVCVDSRHVSPVSTRASTLEASMSTLSNILGSSQMSSSAAATGLPPFRPRNIVILLDGTGNQFSAQNSNVIKLMSVLQADEDQLLYYSSGVGTIVPGSGNGMWSKFKSDVMQITDEATAVNFDSFVCDAYRFLMDYYNTGDRVFLFGFSRGAYTARALAGMVQKVGLLPRGNHNQIQLAYEVYSQPDEVSHKHNLKGHPPAKNLSTLYRGIFGISRPVYIHFLGVWDTVSSLGGLDLPRLAFAGGVRSVTFFRQALALDERRARFAPEYRTLDLHETENHSNDIRRVADDVAQALRDLQADPDYDEAREKVEKALKERYPAVAISGDDCGHMDNTLPRRKNVEAWFMGCHSDVGGGNDDNEANSLSNIPFRWMLREAEHCGLQIDAAGLAQNKAIADLPIIKETNIIPTHLRELLEREVSGDIIEHDAYEEVRNLVEQYLPPAVLHEIIQMAAAYDSMQDDELGDGGPLSHDMLRLPKESLTAKWMPLEFIFLKTRHYTGTHEAAPPADTWKLNLGKARQILSSHFIHRSVQKRMRYDRPLHNKASANPGDKYGNRHQQPYASLPAAWGVSWEDLRLGKGPMIWED